MKVSGISVYLRVLNSSLKQLLNRQSFRLTVDLSTAVTITLKTRHAHTFTNTHTYMSIVHSKAYTKEVASRALLV